MQRVALCVIEVVISLDLISSKCLHRRHAPRYQLALALLLAEGFERLAAPVQLRDPVFTELDRKVLEDSGCQVGPFIQFSGTLSAVLPRACQSPVIVRPQFNQPIYSGSSGCCNPQLRFAVDCLQAALVGGQHCFCYS